MQKSHYTYVTLYVTLFEVCNTCVTLFCNAFEKCNTYVTLFFGKVLHVFTSVCVLFQDFATLCNTFFKYIHKIKIYRKKHIKEYIENNREKVSQVLHHTLAGAK